MINEVFAPRQIETIETNGLDKSLLRKKGTAKTFLGWILARMQDYRKEGNFEMALVMETIYKKGMEYQTSEQVRLKSWKGKSSIQIINKPDYFIVITYQKPDQDSSPKEIKREITKQDVNSVIYTLNLLTKSPESKKTIKTRDIGEKLYKTHWDNIFSNRPLHTELNLILRLLDHYGIIRYRGAKSTILKEVREIQEILK